MSDYLIGWWYLLLFHNSYDLFYRNPFGAVTCNKNITIRLKVNAKISAHLVELFIVTNDLENRLEMYEKENHENYNIFECELTASDTPGLMWYYFVVHTNSRKIYYGNNTKMLGGVGEIKDHIPPSYQITVYKNNTKTPDWLKEAVMYQIFVDRFFNGNEDNSINNPKKNSLIHSHWDNTPIYIRDIEKGNVVRWDFFGGNLLGIIKKLPYLKELGITVIYLNPIFESSSNHKYDTGNYKKIDPMFGDNELFVKLCKKADEFGIKIILDGVFSHTGSDSIYFNKDGNYESLGAFQSKQSPYYSWYRFHEYPNKYECWWGVESLPNVNELEPSYQKFIIHDEDAIAKYWLKLGAKGWRLDVVDELPSEFVKMLKKAVKSVDPNAVLIGEVWEDASNKISYGEKREYLLGDELDSVTNYPLRNAIFDFILGYINAGELHNRIMNLFENYPLEHFYSVMNLLGSHDTPRALTILSEMPSGEGMTYEEKANLTMTPEQEQLGIKRMKMASLFIMTFPGMPCIYYGDEAGVTGYDDPLCRKTFPWGNENTEILLWYKKIVSLRHKYDALKTGKWEAIVKDNEVYGYARYIENGKDVFGKNKNNNIILVVINRSKKQKYSKVIDVARWNKKQALDLINESLINIKNNNIEVTLHPLDTKVLLLK